MARGTGINQKQFQFKTYHLMHILYICSSVAGETGSEILSCGHYNTEIYE